MMQNGMPGQQQLNAAMQRPQPGNPNQQLFARIVNEIKNNIGQFQGAWQATLDPRTRAGLIVQLVTALRMLEADINKCITIAQRFERQAITNAQNKQHYEQAMQAKLEEIKQKREQSTQMPQNGGMPASMQQQMAMGMMHGNVNAGGQQGFPRHLQRQMQPTLLQPPNQMPTTMDPSSLMAQPQVNQQFPVGMNTAGVDMQQDMNQTNASAHQEEVHAVAQQLLASMPDAKKSDIRKSLFDSMTEQQRQQYSARQGDPLKSFVIQRARAEVAKRRGLTGQQPQMSQQQQQQQQQINARMAQSTPNLSLGDMSLGQGASSQSTGNFSLSQLYGQQANALKMQEFGEPVVPISNNVNMSNVQGNVGQNNALKMMGQASQMGNGTDPQRQAALLLQQQQQQAKQKLMQDQINRNNMARSRAGGNQAHPLSGQPGGLNPANNFGNGSPAMPMLNQPLRGTSDQQNFNLTPQPPQQNFPFPGGNANALAHHHQGMINQNNQIPNQPTQNGPLPNQYVTALLNSLEPALRNKILAMQGKEKMETLHKLKLMHDQRQQGQTRQDASQAQNALLGLLPGGQQQQQQQGLGGNAQAPQDVQRMNYIKGQAMMSRLLPPDIGSQLGIQIPPQVQRWQHLRAHIQQNPNVYPPQAHQRMMQLMDRHFAQNPSELQQGIQEIMAIQRRQMAARNAGGPDMSNMPSNPNPAQFMNQGNGMQMAAPVAPMGTAMNQAGVRLPGNLPQVSAQEISRIRMARNIGPDVSDEQLRNVLMRTKLAQMQAKQQQAVTAGGQAAGQGGQGDMMLNLPGNNRSQAANRTSMQNLAHPAAALKQQPQAGKRPAPANDDVVEIPNPNAAATAGKKTAPPINFTKMTPQQLASINPEQLAKLPPELQANIQQRLRSMQNLSQAPNQIVNAPQAPSMKPSMSMQMTSESGVKTQAEHRAMVQRLYHEIGSMPAKGGPVKVEASQVNELRVLFRKMWKPLQALDQTMATAFRVVPGFNDEQAKSLLRAKHTMMQNIADEEGGIRGHLSASASALKQLGDQIMRYYAELQKFGAKRSNAQAPENNVLQRARAPPTQAAPAMAANQSQQSQGRKNSAASKAPAAPVDDKKFWSGVSSPHGVPKYESQKPDLTADQLKIPLAKKRKTGPTTSQPTTPANASTPSMTPKLPSGKIGGPELTRVTPRALQPEQQRFKCPHGDSCDVNVGGFETEAQLKAHMDSAHAVIDDPFKFLMSATSEMIKVDSALSNKHVGAKLKAQSASMIKTASKQSNKAVPTKIEAAVKESTEEDRTMEAIMMEKMGYTDTAAPTKEPIDANEDTIMSEIADVLASNGLDDPFDFDFNGEPFLGVEALGSGTPELTPGDANSNASRDSELSDNERLRLAFSWDPFDTGDTYIPSFLTVNDGTKVADVNATSTQETSTAVDDTSAEKVSASAVATDKWDWSNDFVNWDDMLNSNDPSTDPLLWDDTQTL
ncbi:hypothetical protein AMS68_000967 [Peltaster fructicola]|uniref:Mediator complex subunit 15 KIX domain-containing protein n=1 Tax=Peltaster fructicola TaxID=286661 RepID=A0A6H0XLS1_9PEZI|nr:hypothetical protein AMS68_000967 [Peltaster fructicola]